jgi:hypothetical protein
MRRRALFLEGVCFAAATTFEHVPLKLHREQIPPLADWPGFIIISPD